jgi:hypothetical protein
LIADVRRRSSGYEIISMSGGLKARSGAPQADDLSETGIIGAAEASERSEPVRAHTALLEQALLDMKGGAAERDGVLS